MTPDDPSPAWMATGACRTGGHSPSAFYAPADVEDEDRALAICRTCQHETTCLVWVMRREAGQDERYDIYGATRPFDRFVLADALALDQPDDPEGYIHGWKEAQAAEG